MNTSQPISSHINSVSFGFLSSADIRALSAKHITSATTFDTLLNPIPGGLYSPELGQFGDNACATCGLKNPQCPGHCGHIELPVPCYHPTFLDQVLRLLRATCVYCHRLTVSRVQVQKIVCKLRLVRYGMLKEAQELEELTSRAVGAGKGNAAAGESEEDEDEDEMSADAKSLMERQERFVKYTINTAQKNGTLSTQKTEATNSARKAIIADFMASITKSKKCANCQGINHAYRKDRFVKIFRKPLKEKERVAMVQSGHRARDPMLDMRKRQRVERSRKRKRDADEAVADLDVSEEEMEEEEEEEEEEDEEVEIADGSMLDSAAGEGRTKKSGNANAQEDYLNPSRVLAQLTQLFEREQEVLALVYGQHHPSRTSKRSKGIQQHTPLVPDMFFMKDILIPPNRYRPEARTGSDEIAEAQENTLYKNILNTCETLANIQRELSGKQGPDARYSRARTYADFEATWIQLQDAVNSLIDRDRNPIQGAAGLRNADGIKQKLEKKEGMFRKYMMGKRVNFAARTVISPDPNIETNEIGVPPVFAVKLTYPEPVTQWNVEEMQEAVRNGPFVWPGAVAIESETGQVVSLERKNAEERTALANQLLAPDTRTRGTRPKKVHRHLNNGDIVIMNRQPTLHKPSMMCHRARVLPGEKTLRMHYANCNTYNADFDGDEMNLHLPQNELARAEALSIADTDHQYLSSTAGNPLRGLIQDHVSMGVRLTSRDTLFERGEYMQLLYAALRPENGHCASGRVEMVPPAIMKPKALWTGKQVFTSVLLNVVPLGFQGLTMTGKSTTDAGLWGRAGGKEEGSVVVKEGYLCQGVLDKKQIGPSSGGIVNAVYEVYGHTVAGRLLSVMGRLLTRLENMRAFSCGVEDLVFTREGEGMRREALRGVEYVGLEVAKKYVGMEGHQSPESGEDRELRRRLEDVLRDDAKHQGLDQLTNNATRELSSAVTSACLPAALVKSFPKNQMQTMTASGAKGSKVNANQISCNLGQQVLEGRRVPVMVSGKTLPCFKPFESSVRAGGYIVDRFLTGVRPQEFFFHAMAGREGLIDTAVKTSRSGYLQRCLVKGMEGLKVEYDTSVRDTTDGSVVQFLYGEDGLDVAKAKYMGEYKFAAENHMSLFQGMAVVEDFGRVLSEEAREWNRRAEKKYRKTGDLAASEPALGIFAPAKCAGSTSERHLEGVRKYMEDNPEGLIRDKKQKVVADHAHNNTGSISKRNFQAILDVRYLKSVVEAGEAVGVIAGQSIGEPSTQMTLNTFHLAGHAAKNVTLGIPRLREIVMTAAKKISTPTMTLRLGEGLDTEEGRKFAKGISRVSLAEVVDRVIVSESSGKGVAHSDVKRYEVRLEFFPKREYEREYAATAEDIVRTLEHGFLPNVQKLVRKELKKRGDKVKDKKDDAMPEIGKAAGTVEQEKSRPEGEMEGGDDDSDGEGDDDATKDKAKRNVQQAGYEAIEDEEEEQLAQRNRRDEETEDETYGGSPRPSSPARSEMPGDDEDDEGRRSKHSDRTAAAKDRENRIRGDKKTSDVTAFSFSDRTGDKCTFALEYDASTAKILMLHLVETALKTSLIHSVLGISSAMLDESASKPTPENPKPPAIIITSGVNIPAMRSYQNVLHPHHLYTNSVHDMLQHYGVEAARNTIVIELQSVFSGHGISVDTRHLTLIADYMTREGNYQAFSRTGYRSSTSPFMKMSFETVMVSLREAVVEGEQDRLMGPSARIVVGKLSGGGTGGFDVFLPVDTAEEEQRLGSTEPSHGGEEGDDVKMVDD